MKYLNCTLSLFVRFGVLTVPDMEVELTLHHTSSQIKYLTAWRHAQDCS